MKIAFQIDKISGLKPKTDTSLLIMKAALKRGFDVWFYYPANLTYKNGEIFAQGFTFDGTQNEPSESTLLNLDDFNFIFLRQDPPFDMNYLTTTYLLEKLKKAKVLNNPTSVRNCPEKLFVLEFAKFMPETLISNSEPEIREFWKKHKEIIIKPLFAHGGIGVFYIPENDKNLFNATRILQANYNNLPVIAQKYLPNVVKGDKRILFINGEFAGALNRIQATDFAISNTAIGGGYEKTVLTAREQEMCRSFYEPFKKLGLFLVGIDVIDDHITEINVTSPTGFVLINELYGIKIEEKIIDEMLKL
jgi:glutathione synthase